MSRAFLMCALLLLFSGAILAATNPIDKGSLYLSGNVFFRSQSGDLWESNGDALITYGGGNGQFDFVSGFEVSPTVGYFVAPRIFLGGQIAFTGYSQGDQDLTAVVVGPTVGYFFDIDPARTEVKGAVYPYIRGFFNWGHISDGDNDITILQYGGRGGILYMLTGAVGVDANVRFQGDSWKADGANDSVTGTTLSVGVGITAFIY
jgi:hypothetical protein